MALTRVDPLRDVVPLWNAMDRLITDTFATSNGWSGFMPTGMRQLPVEVYETPDQFVVRAFAPGVNPDNLSVEYDAGTLTIRARTEAPNLKDGWKAYLSEVPYGEFVRQLRLPRKLDLEHVESTFEHGVLTLALPKATEARPHRIEIRTPAQIGSGESPAEG